MKKIRLTESQFRKLIQESVNKILTEAFKSNTLRSFFQQHGGVNTNQRQFSLGDISEEQIGYVEEFNSPNEAFKKKQELTKPNHFKGRSDHDMNYLFHIFTANDGTAILVGVDRNTIQTGSHWSGEQEKKVADRLWRNGWNNKTRDNRYVDDSDTYYYQSPAKDFGVYTNNNFQGKMSTNKKALEAQPKELQMQFKNDKLKHMRDYLQRNYPQTFNKLNK